MALFGLPKKLSFPTYMYVMAYLYKHFNNTNDKRSLLLSAGYGEGDIVAAIAYLVGGRGGGG